MQIELSEIVVTRLAVERVEDVRYDLRKTDVPIDRSMDNYCETIQFGRRILLDRIILVRNEIVQSVCYATTPRNIAEFYEEEWCYLTEEVLQDSE